MEFIERLEEIGRTVTITENGLDIQMYSLRHIGDLIHKLESIYLERNQKKRSGLD
jgi:hypothetical protein